LVGRSVGTLMQEQTRTWEEWKEVSWETPCCHFRRIRRRIRRRTIQELDDEDFPPFPDPAPLAEEYGFLNVVNTVVPYAWFLLLFGVCLIFEKWARASFYDIWAADFWGNNAGAGTTLLLDGPLWVLPGDCEETELPSYAGGHADFLCRSSVTNP
jgi:hypothetical protein